MKRLFMTFAAMLLVSVSAFAQSGNNEPLKGEDGTVDVADIVDVIKIIKNSDGSDSDGKKYWYVGTTKPSSLSQASVVDEYESEYTYINNSGGKANIFALTNNNKSVTFLDLAIGVMNLDQEEVDSTSIQGYKIYQTSGRIAVGSEIMLVISGQSQADKCYWYVGTTKPTSLDEATIIDSYQSKYFYTNDSGGKACIYALTNNDVSLEFKGIAKFTQKEVDSTTIPGYTIYQTSGRIANGGGVRIWVDDIETGISLTPALSKGEGAIYNVSGQHLNKMERGINIIQFKDGTKKKVLIK